MPAQGKDVTTGCKSLSLLCSDGHSTMKTLF